VIGYNWQKGATVFDVEADANWANVDGTTTCYAFSGFFVSANCRAHTDAFETLMHKLVAAVVGIRENGLATTRAFQRFARCRPLLA
jgi:hypothetical protein